MYKGSFGCKSVRLNLNRKSGRKNASLPASVLYELHGRVQSTKAFLV